MTIDPKYLKKYKKAAACERVWKKLIIPLLILEFVLGIIGIVVSANSHNGFLLTLAMISFFVTPFATFFVFTIPQINANKKKEALEKALFDSKMLADDILELGKENGIDLFNVALEARCFHEIGLIGVPEWSVKDRILPTKIDS